MDKNLPDAVTECLNRIGRLPHAAVIRPDDARRWVRRTMSIDAERIEWHIARAGGIGGSEAGAMIAWAFGGMNARETAERLALRKLLVIPPDAPNFDTGRGNYLEPHIRAVYEEKLTRQGRDWRRRDDLRSIIEAGPHPEMPWMRASLDGLYEIDGAIVLPDFKAPSEDTLDGYMRHHDYDDYRAQLNHYALVAEGRGVRIDKLELAFYDYRRVSVEGVRICPVALDRDLQDRLAQACDTFWNHHVAHGIVPREDRERVLGHRDVPVEVEAAARRAVDCKILADQFGASYEEARGKVARWVSTTGRLRDGMLPLGSMTEDASGFLEMRAKTVIDLDAAVARLRDLGMPEHEVDGLRLPPALDSAKAAACYQSAIDLLSRVASGQENWVVDETLGQDIRNLLASVPGREKSGFDPVRVEAALVSFGEVPYIFHVERVAGTLPRGKSQDLLERKEILSFLGDGFLDSLVACKQVAEELHEESPSGPTPGRQQ